MANSPTRRNQLLDCDWHTPTPVSVDGFPWLWHGDDQHSVLAEAALHALRLAPLKKGILLDELPAHHHRPGLTSLLMLPLHSHSVALYLDLELVRLVAGRVEMHLHLVVVLVVLDRAAVLLPVQHRPKVVRQWRWGLHHPVL